VLLFPSSFARAATYYVANAGSDQASGTSSATPWQTVAHVYAQHLQPGDTVLFRRGDLWREVLKAPASGTAGAPITFGAWGSGNLPIFDGAVLATSWTSLAGTSVWMSQVSTSPSEVFFNGVAGTPVSSIAAVGSIDQWFWKAGSLYTYGDADPAFAFTAPGIEAGAQNSAIDTNNQSYLIFDSLKGEYSNALGGGGIVIGSTSSQIIVSNCEFSWNTGNGIWIYPSAGGSLIFTGNNIHDNSSGIYESQYTGSAAATPVLIANNNIHDNTGGDGIAIYGNYFTVDHNVLFNNGRSGTTDSIGIHIFTGDDPAQAIFGQHNVVTYNTVSGQKSNAQDGSGIEIDHYTLNNTVDHNIVYGNYGPGIDIYDTTHLQVSQNTSYGNSLNPNGLAPKAEISVSTGGANLVQYVTLENNIGFATCTSCSAVYIDPLSAGSVGLLSQTNLWYSYTKNIFAGPVAGIDMAVWNALPFVKRDFSADPAFQNVMTNNYGLVDTSPGRNSGSIIPGSSFSYGAPDVGALRFYSAGSNIAPF
jgi:parallel beta-helix repeat protein